MTGACAPEDATQAANRQNIEALVRDIAKILSKAGLSCVVCALHDERGSACCVATAEGDVDDTVQQQRVRTLAVLLEETHRRIGNEIGNMRQGVFTDDSRGDRTREDADSRRLRQRLQQVRDAKP